jgi:hypothetical protein
MSEPLIRCQAVADCEAAMMRLIWDEALPFQPGKPKFRRHNSDGRSAYHGLSFQPRMKPTLKQVRATTSGFSRAYSCR